MSLRWIIFSCFFTFCMTEPTWDTLRVTWGRNPLSSINFSKMPLTIGDASGKGFRKLPGKCSGGNFYGHRYIKGQDSAVVLIYDSKGYVAGIQTGIPAYFIKQMNTDYPYSKIPSFQLDKIDDEEVYFLTAYFVDPQTICRSERSHDEFEENIGNGLWFQNGLDPIDAIKVPLYEKNVTDEKWSKGGCFRSMGQHYWYKLSEDMDCNKFFPFFLMYNRGKLTGFGFALIGNFQFTSRYEHPNKDSLSRFLDPVPMCLNKEYDKAGGFTTLHVYFTVRPWNLFC
ncbi:uncharacterized protein [Centruroides vittatus]|uniref:uncharacterized protein n=1 Tax=Centruroides vittatus TaxID=120091 RepID=UPI00350EBE27